MNILTILTYFIIQSNVSDWQTYKSLPQVDVLYTLEQCHDEVNGMHREYILLKFVNKTDKKIKLDWQYERYEDGTCNTCGSNEYKYSLVLKANETIEAKCDSKERELKVFVKHLDLPNVKNFSKFELGGLKVTEL
jgi:hypothetical protein